jgi:hypothetical protein
MQWTRPLGGMAPRSQNDFRVRGNHSLAEEASPMPQVSVLRIDIAKQIFHIVGMDDAGTVGSCQLNSGNTAPAAVKGSCP